MKLSLFFGALMLVSALVLLTLMFGPIVPVLMIVGLMLCGIFQIATRATRKPWMHAGLPVLVFALLLPVLAFAQTTVTSTAPSETTINVGQLLAPWLQALIAAIVSLILALFGWLTVALNKRAGLESNAAVLAMEAHTRELLDTALTNAAGSLVMMAGNKLDGLTLDVHSPLIAQGVTQVNAWAQSAVVKFGLTPDDIAKKLIDKIGVITASNPAVTPTTTAPAAVAASLK